MRGGGRGGKGAEERKGNGRERKVGKKRGREGRGKILSDDRKEIKENGVDGKFTLKRGIEWKEDGGFL